MTSQLRFRKEFYPRDVVDEAVLDWAEVGTFAVSEEEGGDEIIVTIESLAEEDGESVSLAEIEGEFGNYLLGVVMNSRR